MTMKSALSIVALSAALVAGPALAQDHMIGTLTVTDADIPAVQAYCDELAAGGAESTVSVDGEDEEGNSTLDPTDSEDTTETDADDGDQAAGDSSAESLDLTGITLEDCEAAVWLAE